MKAPRLGFLHHDMVANNERRVRFNWTNGAVKFSVVFIIDPHPFLKHLPAPDQKMNRPAPLALLMFGVVGGGYAFTKPVYPGFWFDTFMGPDLPLLQQALRSDSPAGKPLDVNGFFADFVSHVPTALTHTEAVQWKDLPWRPDVEEADKTYFLGYRTNPSTSHVTAKNLEKTELAAGELAAKICRELNVSSCWTADPVQAKPLGFPPVPHGV